MKDGEGPESVDNRDTLSLRKEETVYSSVSEESVSFMSKTGPSVSLNLGT